MIFISLINNKINIKNIKNTHISIRNNKINYINLHYIILCIG